MVDYLLDSGSDLTVIPRSILERSAGKSLVNEVPVVLFEIGLARRDVKVSLLFWSLNVCSSDIGWVIERFGRNVPKLLRDSCILN